MEVQSIGGDTNFFLAVFSVGVSPACLFFWWVRERRKEKGKKTSLTVSDTVRTISTVSATEHVEWEFRFSLEVTE